MSKILNALKKNNINIQSIKFNIPNFMENITNKSYYIYYKEIMELVENNKYTPNKLLSLYTDLTKNITDLNNTKKIYPSIQEESIKNIISTAINSSEIMIEKKTITYNNALKYAICNVNNKVIAEAIYILSQELQLSNPLEAYKILINIPIYFEQIYKKANYSMAHILLSLEDNEFETLNLSCPDLQANKLNKMQMIIAHLSESGSTDKDLFNKILNEYVFNQGIVESKDNPFESILINQELFPPKTSDLLFVLDAWKKYVENPNKFNLDEQHDQSETSITQPKLLYR